MPYHPHLRASGVCLCVAYGSKLSLHDSIPVHGVAVVDDHAVGDVRHVLCGPALAREQLHLQVLQLHLKSKGEDKDMRQGLGEWKVAHQLEAMPEFVSGKSITSIQAPVLWVEGRTSNN